MKGWRRWARRRASTALFLPVFVVLFVLLAAGTALAGPPWSDAPNAWWMSTYGVSEGQVATVAEGYPDNTFRPGLDVTRAQTTKMVVDGTGTPTATPVVPTFTDVPPSHYHYPWIEGGVVAGLVSGRGDGTFGPDDAIIRQQANSILGSYLAQEELNLRGHIAGDLDNYASLNTWYVAEGLSILAGFADASRLSPVHAPATAYLVHKGVVEGVASGGALYLAPNNNLNRGQAAVMILRALSVQFSTALPTITSLVPTGGPETGGNSVAINGTNFTEVTYVKFGSVKASFVVDSPTKITAVAPPGVLGSTVEVTVTTAAGTSSTAGTANDYSYAAPTVTSLTPNGGPSAGGNTVIIAGTFLQGATEVKFGTVKATSFVVNSATKITAVAPAGTIGQTVDVTVKTPTGTSSTEGTGNDYTYGIPTVTVLNPTGGPVAGGTFVVITGTEFVAGATVHFGAASATNVKVVSKTKITCSAPAHAAGPVDVTVTTAAGTSATAGAANDYTYYGPPVKLGLTTQPGQAENGKVLGIAPVVQIQDAAGYSVLLADVTIVVEIYSGTGVLTGTTTMVTDAKGSAKFSNLIITGTPGYFRLKFSATALTPVVSNSFKLTDTIGPVLTITGATANGADMPGSVAAGFTLSVDGNPATNYLVQFKAGSTSNEPLANQYFGLYFVPSLSSVTPATLDAYYDAHVVDPWLTYLKSAAHSTKPFVYIKGGVGNTIALVDAAKHDLIATDTDMTIPGDYPLGTYVVRGTIKDEWGNPTTVTLKLIIQQIVPTVSMGALPAVIVEGNAQAVTVTVTDGLPGVPVHLEVARTEPTAGTTYLSAIPNISGQASITIPSGATGWGNLNLTAFYTGTANSADPRLATSATVSLYCARASGISLTWTDDNNVTLPAGLGAGCTGPVTAHSGAYSNPDLLSSGAYDNTVASPLVLTGSGIPSGTLGWFHFTASTNSDNAPNWIADTHP